MNNEFYFAEIAKRINGNVAEPIKNIVKELDISSEISIWVEPHSRYKTTGYDELFINVGYLLNEDDDGFIITYHIYYEATENKTSTNIKIFTDIVRGLTGDKGAVSRFCELNFQFADLNLLEEVLTENVVISKLLLKKYLWDYHYSKKRNPEH